MADKEPEELPPTIDPDSVAETVCDGPFSVYWLEDRAVITMSHPRPRCGPLFKAGEVELDHIVRARIATSVENLVALRDLLNELFPEDGGATEQQTATGSGGTTTH